MYEFGRLSPLSLWFYSHVTVDYGCPHTNYVLFPRCGHGIWKLFLAYSAYDWALQLDNISVDELFHGTVGSNSIII